jgi:GT2 family glycosyltransferase
MVHPLTMTSEDSTPVISVCVANYNGEDIVADCIESILGQKNAPEFEILVHDDASTDDSLKILAQFESVRVIESSENVGFCISNNRMAAAARGEFILLLNNDAQLFDDALKTLLDESRKYADKAVLGLPQYDAVTRELVDRGLTLDYFCSSVPIRQPTESDVAMVIGACMWVPANLWANIDGFPEWFETNAEDVYLCCYARLLGYRIYVPRKSGFYHLIGHSLGGGKPADNRLQISIRRRYFSERNRLFVQWLFYPAWLVPLTTIVNMAILIIEAIVLSIANRKASLIWDIYLKSQIDAFAQAKTIVRARRVVMQSRDISFAKFFGTFTLIPQKLRLLFSSGLPRT